MKKIIVFLITVFIISSSIAQVTAVNESFEIWPAPEWNTYMYEEGGWVHSLIYGANLGYNGGNCATHKIANGATDDWLVSPQINVVSANYELIFYEHSHDLQYYTYAGVYISTASGDPADGNFVEISESMQIEDQWVEHTIDLSSYNGENIYIAFVFTGSSSCWYKWNVDEVVIAPSDLIDGALTEIVNPTGINPNPSIEDVIVTLHNYGTSAINNVDIEWEVVGVSQGTYQATGLNLNPGLETNITVGSYNFAATGDYLISLNLILTGDINPSNDYIEIIYYVTDPKDASLTQIKPEGYLPTAGNRDVIVSMKNEGDFTINDVTVSWEVEGVSQTDYQAGALDLNPGESTDLNIGQFNFADGLSEITATLIISGDDNLSNNSRTVFTSVNILWESFEGVQFPPEMWSADDYPLKDYFYSPPQGEFYYCAQTDNNMFGEVCDTLFTPLLQIESGDMINFWVNNSAYFTNGDYLIWKDGTTGEIHLIEEINSQLEQWDEVTIDISAAAGINYIGFVNNSMGSFGFSSIDMITSDAGIYHFDNDLGIRDFNFEYLASIDEPHSFMVSLRNYGINEVDGNDYSVEIMTEAGELLAEQSGVTLQAWEEATIEVNHTFSNEEILKIYAVINYSADQIILNNSSVIYSIYTVPSDIETIDVGFPEVQNLMIPFNTGGSTQSLGADDISQNMYYQDELIDGGLIYGVTLYYHEIFAVGQNLPLQVWVKQTNLTNLSGGWIPTDEMQLVFDDAIEVYSGYNSVYIPFDEPVLYTGNNNLVIQYYQYDPGWPFTACRFYSTTDVNGPVRTIRLNDVAYLDPYDIPDYWAEHTDFPYTTFVYQPISEQGIVSGIVYDENNNPMQDVNIIVEETSIEVITDENGEYSLPSLPYEIYEITASYFGYDDLTQTITLNQANEILDFIMEPLPQISLSGMVTGSNAPDIPLEGVLVTIDGYQYSTTYTNTDGEFVFENIYGNKEYTISFSLYGYLESTDIISLEDIDVDLGVIILEEEYISAYNVSAITGTNQVTINWLNPISSQKVKLQNDNNIESYSYMNEPEENVWLGNLFENENLITLTSVEVRWDIYEQTHDFVTIDILDNQGDVLVSSELFLTHNDSVMTIDIPNITIEDDFYAMVHWENNASFTDPLTIDYSEGVPNTAYIKYPGEAPVLLQDFIGGADGSFFVRVNILEENTGKESKEAVSYNIYRGLAENIDQVNSWSALNTEPITGLVFIDETWSNNDPLIYTYAVEAVYIEDYADVTFSNFIEGYTGLDETTEDDVIMYPNPVSSILNLSGVEGTTITMYNIIGEILFSEYIETQTTKIDVSYFENGAYFIRIKGLHKQLIKKLVVAK